MEMTHKVVKVHGLHSMHAHIDSNMAPVPGLIFCIVRQDDSDGQITIQASSPEEKSEWIMRINEVLHSAPRG